MGSQLGPPPHDVYKRPVHPDTPTEACPVCGDLVWRTEGGSLGNVRGHVLKDGWRMTNRHIRNLDGVCYRTPRFGADTLSEAWIAGYFMLWAGTLDQLEVEDCRKCGRPIGRLRYTKGPWLDMDRAEDPTFGKPGAALYAPEHWRFCKGRKRRPK